MNNISLIKIIGAENLKFVQNFNAFRIVFTLISLLFNPILFAQDSLFFEKKNQVTVTVTNSTYIYSADEAFNKQVLSSKIVLKNADVSYHHSGKIKILIASSSHHKEKHFADQVKASAIKKEKERIRALRKKIEEFEKGKEKFKTEQYTQYPSSEKFQAVYYISKDYLAPGYHYDDLSKLAYRDENSLRKLALDYLHAKKYNDYNNKSLNYCFSHIFSVRPPPFLVS